MPGVQSSALEADGSFDITSGAYRVYAMTGTLPQQEGATSPHLTHPPKFTSVSIYMLEITGLHDLPFSMHTHFYYVCFDWDDSCEEGEQNLSLLFSYASLTGQVLPCALPAAVTIASLDSFLPQ